MKDKNEITIVIPTVEYNDYIDEAISSCLSLENVNSRVFININSESTNFIKSKFWKDKRVSWRYNEKPGCSMYENVNDAIKHSVGKWLFILSDDDIILPNFLSGTSLTKFNLNDLYLTRINIIDENSTEKSVNKPFQKNEYTSDEMMSIYFDKSIQHHLSLLLFSRDMYNKIGGFTEELGYPNGYYGDTIFHGKMFSNCNTCYVSSEVVFSRRETSTQGSAKFYFNNVNEYFNVIVNALFDDERFEKNALKRYSTRKKFYRSLIQDRFRIEYSKLSNKTFNKSYKRKVHFIFKQLSWNTGISFKLISPFRIIKYELINLLRFINFLR